MTNQYTYHITGTATKNGLISSVERMLGLDEKMETQRIEDGSGYCTSIQARAKGGSLKQFVGLDKAITVRFIGKGDVITVEIGEANWGDKAAVMTTSMFVLWPLALTSGYGMYKQYKLPCKVKAAADRYINAHAF